jgi:hypothetical protein
MSASTKELHPAAYAILKDPSLSDECVNQEMLDASLSHDEQIKVSRMLFDFKRIFGIDYAPAVQSSGDKTLIGLMLIYPQDVIRLLAAEPKQELVDRLKKRGLKWNAPETKEGLFLTIIWPMPDILHMADTWKDLDAAGISPMYFDPEHGLMSGTIEQF